MKGVPPYLAARLRELPERPGVYFFKSRSGESIYIGKAVSLKKRVAGHFRFFGTAHSKESVMLSQVHTVDVIETPTEADALLMECSLIKENKPKYNQLLRDDKSYPYLKITGEKYPRLLIVHGRKSDGSRYYGPFTQIRLLKQAVKMLRHQFPLRTCTTLPKKVCLMYHIGQCGGPCEGIQSLESYQKTVKEIADFLEGKRDALVRHLSRRMREHAAAHEYEKAQALLLTIQALSSVPLTLRAHAEPSQHLKEFQDALSLTRYPKRMECFDISNIQGKEPVASMVVFEDGRPKRSDYRRFKIKTVKGIDDYRMMQEVVRRRYTRLLNENSSLPDLIVIDGGKGHLSAAKEVLDELGLADQPVVSLAKQHEIIFLPQRSTPHVFPPTSGALLIVRHLRDEAHRFAIQFHRKLHRKAAFTSPLKGLPGIGEKTQNKLLRRFGTVAKIAKATDQELAEAGLTSKQLSHLRSLRPLT